jgi:hypothetical protein
MNEFLSLFANAASELNQLLPGFKNKGNSYKPGLGPYSEDKIVSLTVNRLIENNLITSAHIRPNAKERKNLGLNNYRGLNDNPATPDLVLNDNIIEFKICRPLRDNRKREDTWFKKIFEPNPQAYSTFLDVNKLCRFRESFDTNNNWKRWIVIIGFERLNETEYKLDQFFPNLFEYISEEILNLSYQEFIAKSKDMGTRHPYHQVLQLYAFRY